MATIIFDADGPLYDSIQNMYNITNKSLQKFNLGPLSFKQFRKAYYPIDWNQTFIKYGLTPEQFNSYYEEYKKNEALTKSKLIPSKQLFHILKRKRHNLHIVTAADKKDINERLKNDNITNYFQTITSCNNQCKSSALEKILKQTKNPPIYYIGDATTDIDAVLTLRQKGYQISFLAIVHKQISYSFSREMHISSQHELEKKIQTEKGDKIIHDLSYLAKEL